MIRSLLFALIGLALLAGCGAPTAPAAPPEPDGVAAPAALDYPAVGVDRAPVTPTGLTDDGELAVPPLDRPEEIVYANWSNELAERMPTVLASHVNGRDAAGTAIPGGFARLAGAGEGDEVILNRADGTQTRYEVTAVEEVDKDTFPTGRVFADGPPGRLVLVTCGGAIDPAARSYEANVLVFAEAVS